MRAVYIYFLTAFLNIVHDKYFSKTHSHLLRSVKNLCSHILFEIKVDLNSMVVQKLRYHLQAIAWTLTRPTGHRKVNLTGVTLYCFPQSCDWQLVTCKGRVIYVDEMDLLDETCRKKRVPKQRVGKISVMSDLYTLCSIQFRADSRFPPNQWKTALLCYSVSYCWLQAYIYSIHNVCIPYRYRVQCTCANQYYL